MYAALLTQLFYVQDFPPASAAPSERPSPRASGDAFRTDLERVLTSLSLPRAHAAYTALATYSFTRAAAHIVASWPQPPVHGWPAMEHCGVARLGRVVRSMGARVDKMALEAQGSSLGVYERRWLEQFYVLASGRDVAGVLPFAGRASGPGASSEFLKLTGETSWPPVRILFPTQRYVERTFVEGPPGAGCFFAKVDDFHKRALRPLFYQPVSCRGDILMHAKSLVATGPASQGWVYLGSANFTRAAWGTVAGTPARPTLSVNNWELGIVLPLDSTDVDGSAADAIPYRRPPTPYGASDAPWNIASLGR